MRAHRPGLMRELMGSTFAFMLDAKYFIKTGLIPDVGTNVQHELPTRVVTNYVPHLAQAIAQAQRIAVSILLIACFIVPLAIFLLMVTAIAEQLDERKRNERSERDASTPIDVLPPQSTPDTGVILEPPDDRSKWSLTNKNFVPDLDSDLDSDPDSDLDSESDEAQDSFEAP